MNRILKGKINLVLAGASILILTIASTLAWRIHEQKVSNSNSFGAGCSPVPKEVALTTSLSVKPNQIYGLVRQSGIPATVKLESAKESGSTTENVYALTVPVGKENQMAAFMQNMPGIYTAEHVGTICGL